MTNSFVFYRSYFEAIKDLELMDKVDMYEAIADYSLDDIEPNFNGIKLVMWKLIKPQIDSNKVKRNGGKLGGRPKKETIGYEDKNHRFSENNHRLNNEKANGNGNGNTNGNINDNGNGELSVDDLKNKYLPNKNFGIELYTNETAEAKFFNEEIQRAARRVLTKDDFIDFNSQLKINDKVHKSLREYVNHMRNWITTRPEQKAKEEVQVDKYGKPRPSNQYILLEGKWTVL
jgi:hypothetical protein